MDSALAICALALAVPQLPVGAETLQPCDARPDEYYSALDSQIDAGMVGRIVASVTVVPFQASEWGVRVLLREGGYVARVVLFDGSLFNAYYFHKMTVPLRVMEFSLEPELGERIASARPRDAESGVVGLPLFSGQSDRPLLHRRDHLCERDMAIGRECAIRAHALVCRA
jgi:hypothetical protein